MLDLWFIFCLNFTDAFGGLENYSISCQDHHSVSNGLHKVDRYQVWCR